MANISACYSCPYSISRTQHAWVHSTSLFALALRLYCAPGQRFFGAPSRENLGVNSIVVDLHNVVKSHPLKIGLLEG